MLAATALLLAQLGIAASAPDTVPIDGYAEVHVRVSVRGARAPTVTTPQFPAFLVLRQQSSQHLERDSDGARLVSELQYTLVPTRSGTFTIPPFVARLGRQTARSQPLTIVVTGGTPRSAGYVPEIVARARVDTGESVTFHAMALPETVYVGEQANYQLAVFLNGGARSRVRRLEAIAPEMPGLLAYDPPTGLEEYERIGPGGRSFEAHVYQRPVFALGPGEITIPPARLTYAVPITPSFFAREEHHEAKSPAVHIIAIDPPLAGRPPEYDGAVGRMQLATRVDTNAQVGEPLTLTVAIAGEGNVKLWPAPRIEMPWAEVVPFDERVRLTSDLQTVRGTKEFEFLLTPQQDGPVTLPAIRYAYWDPDLEAYRVAASEPKTLIVAPGRLARAEAAEEPGSRLPLRRVYRGPVPAPWHDRVTVWMGLILLPIPAVALVLARRPRRARRRRPAAIRLRAMRRAEQACDPAEIRAALTEAVVERLGLDPTRPRDADELARCSRRAGVTAESVARLRTVLGALESAAYGTPGKHRAVDAAAAVDAYRAVDREAMMRYSRPSGSHAAAVALLAAALWLVPTDAAFARRQLFTSDDAAAARQARDAFTRGVDAYEMGQFSLAVRSFGEAAHLEPRAPDAWANTGTAAWVSGDTARAVQGWQRALRLEPAASDMRERLSVTPAGHPGLAMSVPPVAADVVLLVGGLLWVVGWSVVAYRGIRRERAATAFPVLGVALIALAAVEPLDRWIAAPDLTVVAGEAVPRVRPMLAADGGVRLRTGELARITQRQGVWIRVVTSTDREGWIPADAVYPLSRD
jgi:tetratricopeptide (TPR) repeat protein